MGGEQLGGARNSCGSGFSKEVQSTSVVAHDGTEVPTIDNMKCPHCLSGWGIID